MEYFKIGMRVYCADYKRKGIITFIKENEDKPIGVLFDGYSDNEITWFTNDGRLSKFYFSTLRIIE